MKAISIRQPWASLIAHGIKDIENRTWKCPQKYIGQRVLIHSLKNTVKDGWKALTREQLKKVIPYKINFIKVMRNFLMALLSEA